MSVSSSSSVGGKRVHALTITGSQAKWVFLSSSKEENSNKNVKLLNNSNNPHYNNSSSSLNYQSIESPFIEDSVSSANSSSSFSSSSTGSTSTSGPNESSIQPSNYNNYNYFCYPTFFNSSPNILSGWDRVLHLLSSSVTVGLPSLCKNKTELATLLSPIDEDLIQMMWHRETLYQPNSDYLFHSADYYFKQLNNKQEEFNQNNESCIEPAMRPILYDWLMEVSSEYSITRECFHLCINYIDRFMSILYNKSFYSPYSNTKLVINKSNYQLLGVTCLYIASKTDETRLPSAMELSSTTDGACNYKQICEMEREVLGVLEWKLHPQTSPSWAKVFIRILIQNIAKTYEPLFEDCKDKDKDKNKDNSYNSKHYHVQTIINDQKSNELPQLSSSSPSPSSSSSSTDFDVLYDEFVFVLNNVLSRKSILNIMKFCDCSLFDPCGLGFYPSAIACCALIYEYRKLSFPSNYVINAEYIINKIIQISGYDPAVIENCIQKLENYQVTQIKEEVENNILNAVTNAQKKIQINSQGDTNNVDGSNAVINSNPVINPNSPVVNVSYPDGTSGNIPQSVYTENHSIEYIDPMDLQIHYQGILMVWAAIQQQQTQNIQGNFNGNVSDNSNTISPLQCEDKQEFSTSSCSAVTPQSISPSLVPSFSSSSYNLSDSNSRCESSLSYESASLNVSSISSSPINGSGNGIGMYTKLDVSSSTASSKKSIPSLSSLSSLSHSSVS